MIILLPPSEGKAQGGGELGGGKDSAECFPDTEAVLKYASRLKARDRQRFYGANTPG